MLKKGLILFVSIIALLFVLSSCKGSRTVKVVVSNAGTWFVQLNVDTGVTTKTGYYTETYDLGDNKANIIVDAFRLTDNAYNLKDLSISIVEQYAAGFLYTATSETKAKITNTYVLGPYLNTAPVYPSDVHFFELSVPLAVATVTYDFSPNAVH